ncbi:hypothetical protein R1sor_012559 [Riccia sorocarpa]|uniref:Major facilitator superfamily (MFS) profile domain-containing protein n=1 Tax=Riccia sorocarpa TaxID=122646 RepID=A0ABD3I4G8_9MARC
MLNAGCPYRRQSLEFLHFAKNGVNARLQFQRFWKDKRLRSLILVIVASILEKADTAAVPSVFREIGLELHASPSVLGTFALVRNLSQAVCSPFAGYLAKKYKRTRVIAAGAFISTIATLCIGTSTTFMQLALSIAASAVGITLTWPAIQSLIADATDDSNRGFTFGWLHLTAHAGSFFGGFVSILLAGTTVMGVPGWRVSFFLLSFLSSLIACALYFFADDPSDGRDGFALSSWPHDQKASYKEEFREQFEDVKRVLMVKTFRIIVAEAVLASFAWYNFSFVAMWLELVGFSHPTTATIIALFIIASSIGGLFGGWMGDRMAGWYPDAGRIIVGQVCVGIAVPFTAVLLLALPIDPPVKLLHGGWLFVTGFLISWYTPSTNAPLMAEIVPRQSRTNVYALERAFASLVSAFGPPITGILSERVFGYVHVAKGSSASAEGMVDRANAVALGKAIFSAMGVPFFFCCLIFFLLYNNYPRDRDKVRSEMYVMDSDLDSGMDLEELNHVEQGSDFDYYEEKDAMRFSADLVQGKVKL